MYSELVDNKGDYNPNICIYLNNILGKTRPWVSMVSVAKHSWL